MIYYNAGDNIVICTDPVTFNLYYYDYNTGWSFASDPSQNPGLLPISGSLIYVPTPPSTATSNMAAINPLNSSAQNSAANLLIPIGLLILLLFL